MSETTPKKMLDPDKLRLAKHYIINHPDCIPLLKRKWVSEDILMMCMEEEPSIFRYFKSPTLNIIRRGLELDGGNLQFVPKKRRKKLPMDFFMIAVDSNPRDALPFVPKKFISEETRRKLFVSDPSLIKDNDLDMMQTDFLKARIEECPADIKYIKDPSNELKCIALRSDPNTALYFDELTPEMMDIIDELYPSLKDSLPNYRR